MSANQPTSVYQEAVRTTRTYLGPAAERFIDRQVKNHLDKEPDQLTAADVGKLIDWIRISVSFLTEDSQLIEEYIGQLHELAGQERTVD